MMATMGTFGETIYTQPIQPDKNELYDDFIRRVLQAYQAYKQMFTPYAPDVQAGNIKASINMEWSFMDSCNSI